MILRPVQRPHPPLWYGTTIPDNADWPAANDVNIVTIGLRPTVRAIIDRYRAVRAQARQGPRATFRCIGVARHVVVADTDDAGAARSRGAPIRAGARASAGCSSATAPSRGSSALYPPTFDELMAIDNGIAGSPRHGARLHRRRDRGDRQPTTCCRGSRSAT